MVLILMIQYKIETLHIHFSGVNLVHCNIDNVFGEVKLNCELCLFFIQLYVYKFSFDICKPKMRKVSSVSKQIKYDGRFFWPGITLH